MLSPVEKSAGDFLCGEIAGEIPPGEYVGEIKHGEIGRNYRSPYIKCKVNVI
jgi:hypothetical protein